MKPNTLQAGDLMRCPFCAEWHTLVGKQNHEHKFIRALLFYECNGDRYFAGMVGAIPRYPTKSEERGDEM